MEIWKDFFQVRGDLIGSTLVDLCEIQFGGSLGCKLQDDQYRLTRASVLLAPLCCFFALFQCVYFVATSLRAVFQVYLS